MTRPILRLVADDLTGALDSAAELTGVCGPVPLRWQSVGEATGSVALDTGTREASRDAAMAKLRAVAPALRGADGAGAFGRRPIWHPITAMTASQTTAATTGTG